MALSYSVTFKIYIPGIVYYFKNPAGKCYDFVSITLKKQKVKLKIKVKTYRQHGAFICLQNMLVKSRVFFTLRVVLHIVNKIKMENKVELGGGGWRSRR